MTAKEKASELVIKFYPHVRWKMGQEDVKARAKNAALIVVDEILDIVASIYSYDSDVLYPYWQEVKQEIEKL